MENKGKQVKHIINVVLAAVAIAMGVAVIVLPMVDDTVTTNDLVQMLGVAATALGILALNKEDDKNYKPSNKDIN